MGNSETLKKNEGILMQKIFLANAVGEKRHALFHKTEESVITNRDLKHNEGFILKKEFSIENSYADIKFKNMKKNAFSFQDSKVNKQIVSMI